MTWLSLASQFLSIAALAAVAPLWLRVRRLERSVNREPKNPPGPVSHGYQAMELTLEAMLEELESKSREALKRIDRRERELRDALTESGARSRETLSSTFPDVHQDLLVASAVDRPALTKPDPGTWGEKSDAILRLADEGLDVLAIAQRLGLGKGEVQLILDLRKTAQ